MAENKDKLITLEGLEQYHNTLKSEILNNKIDKIENPRSSVQVYAAEAQSKNVILINMAEGTTSSSIAKRTKNGQLRASGPLGDEDLTTKEYVDNLFNNIPKEIVDLGRSDEFDLDGIITPGFYCFQDGFKSKLLLVQEITLMAITGITQTLLPDCTERLWTTLYETPDESWYWTDWENNFVDKRYNSKSENAQSGKAVAEALNSIPAISQNDLDNKLSELMLKGSIKIEDIDTTEEEGIYIISDFDGIDGSRTCYYLFVSFSHTSGNVYQTRLDPFFGRLEYRDRSKYDDLEVSPWSEWHNPSTILTSPNGTKYKLSVSDNGELITTLVD